MQDALSALLLLPEQQKNRRGLTDTPREIQQQPETWLGTYNRLKTAHGSILGFLEKCGPTSNASNPPDVILVGAGTSDYIGLALSRILRKEWRCNVAAVASTELLTNLDDHILPGRKYLMISFSRSGQSSEGIAVIEHALSSYPRQIHHMLITCNKSGTMAKFPDVFTISLDDAVNDRGLAMTSSFSNMVITGQYLAYVRSPQLYEPILNGLAEMGSWLLPRAANLAASLAKKNFSRVCFLGTGALQAVARESALKVLELNGGKIATLAESFLGLRHGPMSFLNKETLVTAFLSGDEDRLPYELDLLEEIRHKNLAEDILVVAPKMLDRILRLTHHVLPMHVPPAFPDACRPPVDIIPGQLLALFLAIENGITPDTPSDGAISRVVSHVKIYSPTGRTEK
ncbi:MAG TPA: SIS domain-containing protein [Pseudacidobacterium sp.]|nr:SIS domain-containing protein [Pseudacidobacterium sp.]